MHNWYLSFCHISPTWVQNTFTLVQKKDVEFHIIEGLHKHDAGHEINIYNNKKKSN